MPKIQQSGSRKRPLSTAGPGVLAKRSKQDQQTEDDSDTEVEEEILQQIDQDRPKVKKWPHPSFQTWPPELTDTGPMRQKVKQLVNTSRGNTYHLKTVLT